MFKLVLLAVTLSACSCQVYLNNGITGESQYILVPVQSSVQPSTLSLPYLKRQAVTLAAPKVIAPISRPVLYQAPVPRPVVYQAPAPRQVLLQAPKVLSSEISGPPEPYTFGFQSTDEFGTILSRSETADGSGAVKGSYSYTDADGLNRIVEYIADAAGYRASVKTNEPGTANANPADVQIIAEDAPSQVQAKIQAYSVPKARHV
jgi:hypothetical protein